ncbi:putative folate-sensitive fragile site protein Fra10Ac1 [Lyophyllum shimeji]|uniref:Folate-sensitive fragile site protein Fra10Ac1 n=1 Tax=Lyophyllum shimeji TaxID=47721 RepID=A0A9P3PRH1_LYOSH|nr:putative folate-sensitive fragile site protein Fra10Ac1 [Lyophyllum shimeji]
MALYPYGSTSKVAPPRTGITEFEILKARHRFLRDEDDDKDLSWDEQLALKYYESLYREFAVCDLKHYKSGNFALRWRTEDEVLSGAGETTCGNTRCEHHHPIPDRLSDRPSAPPLTTLELPFAYVEHGESKSALVKVVLCPKCFDKLMYKRRKEKGKDVERHEHAGEDGEEATRARPRERKSKERERRRSDGGEVEVKVEESEVEHGDSEERRRSKHRDKYEEAEGIRRRRSSRSRSPRARHRSNLSPARRDYRSEREHRYGL